MSLLDEMFSNKFKMYDFTILNNIMMTVNTQRLKDIRNQRNDISDMDATEI